MKEDDVLSGFSAVFDAFNKQPNDPDNSGQAPAVDDDENSLVSKIFTPTPDPDENEPGEPPVQTVGESDNSGSGEPGEPANPASDNDGAEIVTGFFDAIAEAAGWENVTYEEKHKSAEALIDYMKKVIEESSVPSYANDQIAMLDEYVRNGGTIESFLQSTGSMTDYSTVDISNENVQKAVLKEFLMEKGFTEQQANRKIEKYEDADILEDEAIDALDSLKEIKEEKKKALLEDQKNAQKQMIEEQQRFYNNVVQEIEALTDIRGVQVPETDKKVLMDYIFKVEADGRTKYQKDYASSTKHLIESAYFTMKGDKLISSAKKSGETSAIDKLKHTLNSTKVSGSKQKIDNRSAQPLWSVASSQLLRRPQ